MELLRVRAVGPSARVWHPWQHIRELQREVESAFAFVPDVDVYDVDDAFIVRVDLPGVRPEDLDVATEDGLLVVKGTRITEAPEGKAVYAERQGGQFVRTIELPGRAVAGGVKATLCRGVLEIVVSRNAAAAAARVAVAVDERG